MLRNAARREVLLKSGAHLGRQTACMCLKEQSEGSKDCGMRQTQQHKRNSVSHLRAAPKKHIVKEQDIHGAWPVPHTVSRSYHPPHHKHHPHHHRSSRQDTKPQTQCAPPNRSRLQTGFDRQRSGVDVRFVNVHNSFWCVHTVHWSCVCVCVA